MIFFKEEKDFNEVQKELKYVSLNKMELYYLMFEYFLTFFLIIKLSKKKLFIENSAIFLKKLHITRKT